MSNYKQEVWRTRAYDRRPPFCPWKATTVPSWEKKFCSSIGCVPWRRLLDMKKCMHLYGSVVNWNDSAVEEAFNNAKYRFWAKINGLPYNISLPGPDIYIDEVDWDSEVDPELYSDLERERERARNIPDDHLEVSDTLLLDQRPIVPTGWDCDEDYGKATNSLPFLFIDCDKNVDSNGNSWESSCPQSKGTSNENGPGNNNSFNDTWGSNKCTANGEVNGFHMSKNRASRFHGGFVC